MGGGGYWENGERKGVPIVVGRWVGMLWGVVISKYPVKE